MLCAQFCARRSSESSSIRLLLLRISEFRNLSITQSLSGLYTHTHVDKTTHRFVFVHHSICRISLLCLCVWPALLCGPSLAFGVEEQIDEAAFFLPLANVFSLFAMTHMHHYYFSLALMSFTLISHLPFSLTFGVESYRLLFCFKRIFFSHLRI